MPDCVLTKQENTTTVFKINIPNKGRHFRNLTMNNLHRQRKHHVTPLNLTFKHVYTFEEKNTHL